MNDGDGVKIHKEKNAQKFTTTFTTFTTSSPPLPRENDNTLLEPPNPAHLRPLDAPLDPPGPPSDGGFCALAIFARYAAPSSSCRVEEVSAVDRKPVPAAAAEPGVLAADADAPPREEEAAPADGPPTPRPTGETERAAPAPLDDCCW